jgi:thiamine kinase-like enzyme
MSHPITHPNAVTPEWLTGVLHHQQAIPDDVKVENVSVRARLPGVATILPLTVNLSNQATLPLILKLSNEERNDSEEVDFYLTWGQVAALPVIRCYSAAYADEQFHLLFEDLSTTHYSKPPSMLPNLYHECEYMIMALARLHAYWWKHSNLPARTNEITSDDLERMARFIDFLQERLSPHRRGILEHVSKDFGPVYQKRAMFAPFTLIHGDPHPGNFLYPHDSTRDTPRLLDWKSYSTDLGANDLAHMMAVFWFPERRARFEQAFLRFYHARLQEYGVGDYPWDDLWYDYRLSIVKHLFYPAWQWAEGTPDFIW